MRWFVLILLLLNVALYGWFVQEEESRQRMAQRELYVATDIAGLKLLAEVPIASLERRVLRPIAPVPKPRPALNPEAGVEGEGIGEGVAEGVSEGEAAGVEKKARLAAPEEGVANEGVVRADARGESGAIAKAGRSVTAVKPQIKQPDLPLYCYELGPIDTLAEAQRLVEGVVDWVVRSEIRDRRRELAPDYWVYVKTNGKSQVVKALQERLKSNGLESFRIRKGGLAGHVSLGLYRSQESAQALYDALIAQEYPADIFEKKRAETFYLVDVKTEKNNFPLLLSNALQGDAANRVKSEKKVCVGVASDRDRE